MDWSGPIAGPTHLTAEGLSTNSDSYRSSEHSRPLSTSNDKNRSTYLRHQPKVADFKRAMCSAEPTSRGGNIGQPSVNEGPRIDQFFSPDRAFLWPPTTPGSSCAPWRQGGDCPLPYNTQMMPFAEYKNVCFRLRSLARKNFKREEEFRECGKVLDLGLGWPSALNFAAILAALGRFENHIEQLERAVVDAQDHAYGDGKVKSERHDSGTGELATQVTLKHDAPEDGPKRDELQVDQRDGVHHADRSRAAISKSHDNSIKKPSRLKVFPGSWLTKFRLRKTTTASSIFITKAQPSNLHDLNIADKENPWLSPNNTNLDEKSCQPPASEENPHCKHLHGRTDPTNPPPASTQNKSQTPASSPISPSTTDLLKRHVSQLECLSKDLHCLIAEWMNLLAQSFKLPAVDDVQKKEGSGKKKSGAGRSGVRTRARGGDLLSEQQRHRYRSILARVERDIKKLGEKGRMILEMINGGLIE